METSPPTAEQPKPQFRWFKFRLRVLLLVLAIVAVVFYVSPLFRVELPGGSSVAVAIAVIVCIACIGYFGFRLARRHRFQYSLRSLFLLTTLVAICMSWLTVTMQNQREQYAAGRQEAPAGFAEVQD